MGDVGRRIDLARLGRPRDKEAVSTLLRQGFEVNAVVSATLSGQAGLRGGLRMRRICRTAARLYGTVHSVLDSHRLLQPAHGRKRSDEVAASVRRSPELLRTRSMTTYFRTVSDDTRSWFAPSALSHQLPCFLDGTRSISHCNPAGTCSPGGLGSYCSIAAWPCLRKSKALAA